MEKKPPMEIMVITKLPPDVKIFSIKDQKDIRGSFCKVFDKKKNIFKKFNVQQVIYSHNKTKGTIRGMHFQKSPFSEAKIIFCSIGKIYDVFVDFRKKSKNFMKVYNVILDKKNKNCLYLPKGYAHGFQTLKENTTILYLIDGKFRKEKELKTNPFSKKYKIKWPIKKFTISSSDLNSKFIS